MKQKILLAVLAAIFSMALIGCSKDEGDVIITTEPVTTSLGATYDIVTERKTFWYAIDNGEALIIKLSDLTLENVIIPEELDGCPLTGIEARAFMNYTNIISVEWPATVAVMKDQTFYGCTSLESIQIPDGVTSIGDAAFANCTNLKSIKLPASVTSIGEGAFYNCTKLVIHVPKGSYAEEWAKANKYTLVND